MKNMIIHGAIGDTYGAAFEFAERSFIQKENTLTKYLTGKYTDDTQMAIGVAELILENQEWTSLNIANKFVEVFQRDFRKGYARRFSQLMTEVKDGQELLDRIIPKSERNGAAMRAYPIGVFEDEKEVLAKAKIQGEVTHQTKKAIDAAEAIALMSHYFIFQKGNKNQLIEYLADVQGREWKANWNGEVKIDGEETVEAVLYVFEKTNTLQDALRMSIDLGGDTDTVASLALAIGSLTNEFKKDLPQWMYDDLENEKYGKDYMKDLDEQLIKKIKTI
ncbi:MAG: ADP-ribosylglycohydrolase family protein [Saprospiraceae bacterium]